MRTAGRKLVAKSTATPTTTSPPTPMLRVSTSGVNSNPAKPTATESPEAATVTPAVVTVRAMASAFGAPRSSSSRKRVNTSNE